MNETNNPMQNQQQWIENKQSRDQRNERRAELKMQIRDLEAQAMKLRVQSPEAEQMVEQWLGNVKWQLDTLVHQLRTDAALGKTPQITIDSPGLLGFLLYELCAEKLPALAAKVVGESPISVNDRALQTQIINDELLTLRTEYASLGGV